MTRKKVTILDLQRKRDAGEPITMVTAYDYPTALIVDRAGIDIILVGDSLGMVVLGYDSTVPVTMEEMTHHCRAVMRGVTGTFVVGDMPFGSYEVSPVEAAHNAIRLMKEGGSVDAVKLEGGVDIADSVRAITRAGLPVMGHIGLTPQTASRLGGYRVQGKTAADAQRLLDDALALQEAGAFAIVFEAVPDRVAATITERLRIPTIGIGAGPGTSGQVLVIHDLLGLFERFLPPFVRRYAELGKTMEAALAAYHEEVHSRAFPVQEHCYTIDDTEFDAFMAGLEAPASRLAGASQRREMDESDGGEQAGIYGREA